MAAIKLARNNNTLKKEEGELLTGIIKTKLRGRSPQANYTDRATAACRRSQCQPLPVEGVACSVQRIPTAINLGFLDRSRYFFNQVAPQLSSRG
jgi:hypothetical protein